MGIHAQQTGAKINDDDLQHQRRAADDPDKGLYRTGQQPAPAHGAKGHHQPQRQCKQQRKGKQLTVEQERAGKAPKDHRHKNTPIYRFVLRPAQSASASSYFSASACMVPSAFSSSKAVSTAAAASLPLRNATPYSSAFSSSTIFRLA